MKKIIFKSGSTMIGGLEKVQVEYINFLLTQKEYKIKVVIENDNGNENVLEKNINTKVHYLKDFSYITYIKKLRKNRKKDLISRIKYNIALLKEKKYSENKFMEIYREFSPDIVIDFDSSLTRIIKNLNLSKNIVWIHSSVENWKKKRSRINKFTKKLEKYNKVICICQEMMEDLKLLNINLKDKLTYIYNPLDFEKIIEMSKKNFDENEKKLSNEKYLLSISRLDCIPKDFETLFKAFDISRQKGYDGKLYIIGDGPDKDRVIFLKEKSIYKNDIILLGRKENPYNWLKKADKLILSSKYEGLSMVLLEGLILSKNVISSNCKTGPKEILANNKGKLFEIGDFQKLSEYILESTEERAVDLSNFKKDIILKKLVKTLEE